MAVNHVSDSVCSGVSSNFDLATGDLSKYSSIVNKLKDAAVQLELGLDELPTSHLHRRNPRYGQERLQKDIDNEEVHLSKLEAMMRNYREQSDRLQDFETEMFNLDGDKSTEVPGEDFMQNPQESFMQFTQARDLEHALKTATSGLKVATEDKEKEQPEVQSSAASRAADGKLNTDPARSLKKNIELTNMQDDLFTKSVLVRSRQEAIARALVVMEELILSHPDPELDALRVLEQDLLDTCDDIKSVETLEDECWALVAKVQGNAARLARSQKWQTWLEQVNVKAGQLKKACLKIRLSKPNAVPVLTPATSVVCGTRAVGHLERVKLPFFSGRIEEYADFKLQFQELCGGERYPGIIELTQLRQKIPKEAVAALAGLTSPSIAWERLDELYGNREAGILSAVRQLRSFKSVKSAPCDQIIDLVRAVQRCRTLLSSMDATEEYHNDRETTASIVDKLPVAAQERWFQRRPPPDESQVQRSIFLVGWLEEERKAAVAVHLNNLARQHTLPSGGAAKVSDKTSASGNKVETTDQGLTSGTYAVQQESTDERTGGQGGISAVSGPVMTAQQADDVTTRRLQILTEKKLDSCPLCKTRHFFEKTWAKVSPIKKTKMVSTHLSTCPKFMAMSGEDRAKAVSGQGACLHCTAWDHTRHKVPGTGVVAGEPKCKYKVGTAECGAKHGQWFHAAKSDTATTGAVSRSSSTALSRKDAMLPGLYEVYSVCFEGQDGQRQVGTVLIDPGSDTDYVRHDFAKSLGLQGTPFSCFMKVVDMDYVHKRSATYNLDVTDKDGERHQVTALGLDSITTLPEEPNLDPLLPLLVGLPREVLDRPQGQVDVLLGLRSSALHGRTRQEWGNLRLLEARFGCGWVLRGSHDSLRFPVTALRPAMSAEALAMSQATADPPERFQVFHISSGLGYGHEFSELNELGTTRAPVCGRCAGCEDCTFRRKRLSPEDQEVVSRIEASMKIDEVTGIISGEYPWKPCVRPNDRQLHSSAQSANLH